MFGVSLLAILALTGVAIDYGQMTKKQDKLQNQVDAAVLAAVTLSVDSWDMSREDEQAARKAVALEVMKSNGFDQDGIEPSVTITDGNTVLARAELDYRTAFGALVGRESVQLTAESESGYGVQRKVQIALVLDNTASMVPGGKLNALKAGARNLSGLY